ncbi:MAG: hydroxymethylglutaryl-CoA lyase [Desulfobacterales bacterium]|jgi:hydroxymethylglutaryl-CoA lyase
MAISLPEDVTLIEVGPRDGLQSEPQTVPTKRKLEIIQGLVDAGFREIQATAFVHPKWVPQMADADTLIKELPKQDGVVFNVLVLNSRGLERALGAGATSVEVSVSPSDYQSRRNVNMSASEAVTEGIAMIRRGKDMGIDVRAGIQCTFGCTHEGEISEAVILQVVQRFLDAGADRIALADTTGMATPPGLRSLLPKVLSQLDPRRLVLHLHDTRGLGLVNIMTALDFGVRQFDVALGGLGGCPFLKGASGNVATEDTLHLMESLGIATGIDKAAVACLSLSLEADLGRTFPSRVLRVLSSSASCQPSDGSPFPGMMA